MNGIRLFLKTGKKIFVFKLSIQFAGKSIRDCTTSQSGE